MAIKQIYHAPICDYGCGQGLLVKLLKLLDVDCYGVDLQNGKFHPCITIKEGERYRVPKDHSFLVSWGHPLAPVSEALKQYIQDGGRCVIIIGEDSSGCTSPSYDYFEDNPQWDVEVVEIPNFQCIQTKMSINWGTPP